MNTPLTLEQLKLAVPGISEDDTVIRTWSFYDAPEALRDLSDHGGDEDWVTLVSPRTWKDLGAYISWAQEGTPYGCFRVQQIDLPLGYTCLIGAHS